MKVCCRCKTEKEKDEFFKSRSARDGRLGHCKDCTLNETRRWRAKNKEAFANHQSKYREKNRPFLSAYYKKWRYKNWPELKAYLAARKSRVKTQTPSWTDMQAIREIYLNCPKGHHVDHIIPVNGKIVSGLHVPWNLQYLPALENLRKSNKL